MRSPLALCPRILRLHAPVKNILNFSPLPIALSLYRLLFRVASIAIMQSRERMTQNWPQQLTASKLNTRSVLKPSVVVFSRFPPLSHFSKVHAFELLRTLSISLLCSVISYVVASVLRRRHYIYIYICEIQIPVILLAHVFSLLSTVGLSH